MLLYALFGAQRMQTYTVHEMPQPPSDRIDRAEALRFIKDGFELPAFAFAPLWLLGQKLWLGVLGYAVALAALVIANEYLGLPDAAAVVLLIGLHLIIGFEGDAFVRLDLERKGWSTLGSVSGHNRLECERRFLDGWLPVQPILAPVHGQTTPLPSDADRAQARSASQPARTSRLGGLFRQLTRST